MPNERPSKPTWSERLQVAAQIAALTLAERVMKISALADHGADWRRWKVQVVEDDSQRIMTVIFPFCHVYEKQAPTQEPKGARALLQHLAMRLGESEIAGSCDDDIP